MGSWNNTCGLSNLPIHANEEVYVFPIREKDLSGYRSHCYANALYDPVLTPFEAKYNDYGAAEDCTGIMLPRIVYELTRQMVELEQGENKYHDIPVKKDDFDIDKYFEAVHEDRMFVKGYGTANRPVYFTMVRRDVVDRMWNDWTFDMWKGSKGSVPAGFESDEYYVKNVTYAKLAELLPQFVDDCIAEYHKDAEELIRPDGVTDEVWKIMSSNQFRRHFRSALLTDGESFVGHSFRMLTDHQHHWDLLRFKDLVNDAIGQNDRLAVIEILRLALLGLMVNSIMESTRKIWLPAMHMGSQSEEYDVYRMMNTVTNDVMAQRQAYYDEENFGEDEEENLFDTVGIYLSKTGPVE
jgi:hypothetical protein